VPYDRCAFALYDEHEKIISLQALQGFTINDGDRLFDWDENIDKTTEKTIDRRMRAR